MKLTFAEFLTHQVSNNHNLGEYLSNPPYLQYC